MQARTARSQLRMFKRLVCLAPGGVLLTGCSKCSGPLASKTELAAPGRHMDAASAAHNGGVVDAFGHKGVLSHRDSELDGHTDAHQQEGATGSAPPPAAGPLSPRTLRSNTIASRHIARVRFRFLMACSFQGMLTFVADVFSLVMVLPAVLKGGILHSFLE